MTTPAIRWGFLRWPSFLAALSTLILSGWVHGLWTGRWQTEEELVAAARRVDQVPMTIGNWVAESQEVDEKEFAQAGAMGRWARRYTNTRTRDSVLVILMCGRAGKMSVHTPEVCYQGAGFTLVGSPEPCTLKWLEFAAEGSATLWSAQFNKVGTASRPAPIRLFWGWNDGGNWQALGRPRWETRGRPFLYKMYISVEGAVPARTWQAGADMRRAQEFLHEFLPVLQRSLAPTPEEKLSP